jgi:Amt family ammonium transporter
LGVSVLGYWLCGFAFEFGGLGFVSAHPDLAGLAREWSWAPMDATWGTEWGALGLEGYMLRDAASTATALALFYAQLPWITTAVAVPLWSLQGRVRPFLLFLSALLAASIYALLGNWVYGGGWLANLGRNLGLGHGFVDYAGAGLVHLAGMAVAFAGMLVFGIRTYTGVTAEQLPLPALDREQASVGVRWTTDDEPYVPMPPFYMPALGTLGAWLAVIGWIGWVLITPASVAYGADLAWTELLIALALSVAGGAMAALVFSWLTTGRGNALMTARGVIGAGIAAGSCLPFVPFWAALAVGAAAGLLVPFVHYGIEHLLRLDDPTSVVATHGLPAILGLLAVGLFADGHAGSGWNRTGPATYLGVSGQGVTGYVAAVGFASDWPGQIQAQVTGIVAICLTAFVLSGLLFAVARWLGRAWRGEYTVRLPARPRPRRTAESRPARRWPRIRLSRSVGSEPEPGSEAILPDGPAETTDG